jgi:imidazolonepropionase
MSTESILISNLQGIIGVYNNTPPKLLSGAAMDHLPVLNNAWILIRGGKVEDYGPMSTLPASIDAEWVDGAGRWLFPGFIDSHTHLVFAASREKEFEARIRGLSYQEIANQGGGILNSAKRLQETPEEVLYEDAAQRLDQLVRMGTTAIEIKSGYGLTLAAELKMLRVIQQLKNNFPVEIKSTFLGAHAVPKSYLDRSAYLADVLSWIPTIAQEGLSDYIDVFCETNYFSPDDAIAIIKAGAEHGLKAKIHANQLAISGGVQVGVNYNALTVDHLEQIGDSEIEALKSGTCLPVLLPGCSFFLGIPYAPARKLIDAGLGFAIASDYNPGTCPSGNMPFLLSLACTQLKLTPAEAFNATTINAAAALELTAGTICKQQDADLWLSTTLPSWECVPYYFGNGNNLVDRVMVKGQWYN